MAADPLTVGDSVYVGPKDDVSASETQAHARKVPQSVKGDVWRWGRVFVLGKKKAVRQKTRDVGKNYPMESRVINLSKMGTKLIFPPPSVAYYTHLMLLQTARQSTPDTYGIRTCGGTDGLREERSSSNCLAPYFWLIFGMGTRYLRRRWRRVIGDQRPRRSVLFVACQRPMIRRC